MLSSILAERRGNRNRELCVKPVDFTPNSDTKRWDIKFHDIDSAASNTALTDAGRNINDVRFLVDAPTLIDEKYDEAGSGLSDVPDVEHRTIGCRSLYRSRRRHPDHRLGITGSVRTEPRRSERRG
jgi:hypothetical protein